LLFGSEAYVLSTLPVFFMPTNCSSIDRLLGGGIPSRQITLVYGAYSTGKTSFAVQCAVSCARKKTRTLYVDSDDTFSATRLSQIASDDLDSVSPMIIVFKPRSFIEQGILFENLERYLSHSTALIVVDTITSLYRLGLRNSEETFALNRELNRQLAVLTEVAKKNAVALLLTSQVHSVIDEWPFGKIEPVATRVLNFWSQNVLRLSLSEKHPVREATLEKKSGNKYTGRRCPYILTEEGISELRR